MSEAPNDSNGGSVILLKGSELKEVFASDLEPDPRFKIKFYGCSSVEITPKEINSPNKINIINKALNDNKSVTTLCILTNNSAETFGDSLADFLNGNRYITALEFINVNVGDKLIKFLKENNAVRSLHLYAVGDASPIINALKEAKSLRKLGMTVQWPNEVISIVALLKENKILQDLVISYYDPLILTDELIAIMEQRDDVYISLLFASVLANPQLLLARFKSVKKLKYVRTSCVKSNQWEELTEVIESSTHLTDIDITGDVNTILDHDRLCRSILRDSSTLTSVKFRASLMDEKTSNMIGNIISGTKSIQEMAIGHRLMENVKYIVDALKSNTSIKTLQLTNNLFKAANSNYIVELLNINKSITSLNLGVDLIQDSYSAAILNALTHNKAMKKFECVGNFFGEQSYPALCTLLKENDVLEELNISCIDCDKDQFSSICNALKANKALTSITIDLKVDVDSATKLMEDLFKENMALIVPNIRFFDKYESEKVLKRRIKRYVIRNREFQAAVRADLAVLFKNVERGPILPVEIWAIILRYYKFPGVHCAKL